MPSEALSTMRPLNDLFSMAEACLIADSIQVFQAAFPNAPEAISYSSIIEDVRTAISDVHTSGVLHTAVVKDMQKYIQPSPAVLDMLTYFRTANKTVFLCTNSAFPYADRVMTHITGQSQWRQLFDFVICSARKPDFFFSKMPFRRWNPYSNSASPFPVGMYVCSYVCMYTIHCNAESGKFEAGAVYVNGSVHALKQADALGQQGVLYVGDNLYADLVDARRSHGWQTLCVISELDHEICVQNDAQFQELHKLRSLTRVALSDLQTELELCRRKERRTTLGTILITFELISVEYESLTYVDAGDIQLIVGMERELQLINETMSTKFNANFGSVFRTASGSPTIFAFDVRRYNSLL